MSAPAEAWAAANGLRPCCRATSQLPSICAGLNTSPPRVATNGGYRRRSRIRVPEKESHNNSERRMTKLDHRSFVGLAAWATAVMPALGGTRALAQPPSPPKLPEITSIPDKLK